MPREVEVECLLTIPTCASRCRTHPSEHVHRVGLTSDKDYMEGRVAVVALPLGLCVGRLLVDLDGDEDSYHINI